MSDEPRHYSAGNRPPGVTVDFSGDRGISRTKQSEGPATDINAIVKKYETTGMVSHLNQRAPMYGDFSQAVALHEALNAVMEADDAFMTLPAEVRKEAENDPVRFLEMLASPEGTEVLVEAGLDAKLVEEREDNPTPVETPPGGDETPPKAADSDPT